MSDEKIKAAILGALIERIQECPDFYRKYSPRQLAIELADGCPQPDDPRGRRAIELLRAGEFDNDFAGILGYC